MPHHQHEARRLVTLKGYVPMPSPPLLAVARRPISVGEDVVVLQAAGEIDAFSVRALVQELEQCCDGSTDVIVDVSKVTFMDASGVNCLVAAARRLEPSGCTVRAVGAAANVRRVFEVCDVTDVFLRPGEDASPRSA